MNHAMTPSHSVGKGHSGPAEFEFVEKAVEQHVDRGEEIMKKD